MTTTTLSSFLSRLYFGEYLQIVDVPSLQRTVFDANTTTTSRLQAPDAKYTHSMAQYRAMRNLSSETHFEPLSRCRCDLNSV
jgi:hypothetical protein